MEKLTKMCDEGKPVDIIYLDFAKAFDKVAHKRLLRKIEAQGITNQVSGWIARWLSNRMQRVQVGNESSDWSQVISGVPQGSVLGPILFLIYINDIDCDTNNHILKFADDTKLFGNATSVDETNILQRDLDELVSWSKKWQMSFNTGKCKTLHIGHNNRLHNYNMEGVDVATTKQEKDLGVIIHTSMSSSPHVAAAVKKGNMMLGIVRRCFIHKSRDIMLPLYKAIVRPHLEYASQAWNPYLKKDRTNLEKIQRRFTKMITCLHNLSYSQSLETQQPRIDNIRHETHERRSDRNLQNHKRH
jgi:hypothetical protein